jgi:hypothetical protein
VDRSCISLMCYAAFVMVTLTRFNNTSQLPYLNFIGSLCSCTQLAWSKIGSFVNTMGGRFYKTSLTSSLADKKTTTYSFKPVSLECVGCEVNHAQRICRPRGSTEMAVPTVEAFILTDQSFPPILLTTGDLSCLKIICRGCLHNVPGQ